MDLLINSKHNAASSAVKLPQAGCAADAMAQVPECQLLADALADENTHNYTGATEKYTYLTDQGSEKARAQVRKMLLAGHGATEAYDYSVQADKNNSPAAAYILGLIHYYGLGRVKSWSEAFACFQRGDERGSGAATNNLGVMYQRGNGVNENVKEAVACFQRGDERGNGEAAYNLGLMYKFGRGVDKNFKEAVPCYRRAIERGFEKAADWFLVMCLDGRAQKVDLRFTINTLEEAAKRGNKEAEKKLQEDPEIQEEFQKIRLEQVRQIHSRYAAIHFPDYLADENKTIHSTKTPAFTAADEKRRSQATTLLELRDEL